MPRENIIKTMRKMFTEPPAIPECRTRCHLNIVSMVEQRPNFCVSSTGARGILQELRHCFITQDWHNFFVSLKEYYDFQVEVPTTTLLPFKRVRFIISSVFSKAKLNFCFSS